MCLATLKIFFQKKMDKKYLMILVATCLNFVLFIVTFNLFLFSAVSKTWFIERLNGTKIVYSLTGYCYEQNNSCYSFESLDSESKYYKLIPDLEFANILLYVAAGLVLMTLIFSIINTLKTKLHKPDSRFSAYWGVAMLFAFGSIVTVGILGNTLSNIKSTVDDTSGCNGHSLALSAIILTVVNLGFNYAIDRYFEIQRKRYLIKLLTDSSSVTNYTEGRVN